MARRFKKKTQEPGLPTPAECKILWVFWYLDDDPSLTIREVYDALHSGPDVQRCVGYTTVLKQVQVMEGKGILRCVTTKLRRNMYRVNEQYTEAAVLKRALHHHVALYYRGSAMDLVRSILCDSAFTEKLTSEHAREIIAAIDSRLAQRKRRKKK